MKQEIYIGVTSFDGYQIESFLKDNIKLLLKGDYKDDRIYRFQWESNSDYERDEITIQELRLETDDECEFRENQEKLAEEKKKQKREDEDRRQYEKLKAKFEKS